MRAASWNTRGSKYSRGCPNTATVHGRLIAVSRLFVEHVVQVGNQLKVEAFLAAGCSACSSGPAASARRYVASLPAPRSVIVSLVLVVSAMYGS